MVNQRSLDQMQLLVELATREVDKQLGVLTDRQQIHQQYVAELADLQSYRQDYVNTVNESAKGRVNWQLHRQSMQYLQSVDASIRLQQEKIRHYELQLNRAKSDWMEAKAKQDALLKLQQKKQSKHDHALSQKEQKWIDDLMTSRFGRL